MTRKDGTMTRKEFEAVVCEALDRLPKRFKERLKNVAIVIEPGDGNGEQTGLYEGVPLTERTTDYGGVLPDKITLFKAEIEADCKENGLDIRQEVAHVLRHEIAHFFGISDERLDDLGVY